MNKDEFLKKRREYMKRYRSNPERRKKIKKRRKYLRDKNLNNVKEKEKEYYRNNREHILKRTTEYHNKNPDVKKKSQRKATDSGKGILKGKRERENLSQAYIQAQLRKNKEDKSVEVKQTEILLYRLKKAINKHE